jgi:hypothetical protein
MYGYTQPRHPALILERQCPVTWILSKEGLPRVCSEIWARSTYQACMLLHTRPLAQLSYTQLAFSSTPFPITRTGTSYTRLTTPETAPGAVWCFSDLSASPQRLRIHFHLQVLQRPAHRSITLSRMQPRDGDESHSDLVRRGRVPSPLDPATWDDQAHGGPGLTAARSDTARRERFLGPRCRPR